MASLNRVSIIGRLGDEPQAKTTKTNNNPVCNFSVATTEVSIRDGEKTESTQWHKIVAWGKLAEISQQYLHKGSMVYIDGKLATRMFEKDGHKFYVTEIIAANIQFLDSKSTSPKASDNVKVYTDIPF